MMIIIIYLYPWSSPHSTIISSPYWRAIVLPSVSVRPSVRPSVCPSQSESTQRLRGSFPYKLCGNKTGDFHVHTSFYCRFVCNRLRGTQICSVEKKVSHPNKNTDAGIIGLCGNNTEVMKVRIKYTQLPIESYVV